MLADVLILISQLIAKPKDGLHVIAEHGGGQPFGGVKNNSKLADGAVLTLINDQAVITSP
jgi:hypothetical protein